MAQFINIFDVDLQKPTNPAPLRQMVGEGDANGLCVGARVSDNGVAVALGGSCVGKVVRADGATVELTGTISGNLASVVLDQTSCAIEGPIQVAVCWVSGSNVTTLVLAYGSVVHTQTGNAIQPSTPIPDLTELLAEIDAMRTATTAANTAASTANTAAANVAHNFAGAFGDSTAYTAGQYVTYTDGNFYRFITDHAAGAWNSSHVVRVTAGGELGDLKGALKDCGFLFEGNIPSDTVLVTKEMVDEGDVIYYDFDAQIGINCYLDVLNTSNTRITYIGKGSTASGDLHYEGTYTIPANFGKIVAKSTSGYTMALNYLTSHKSISEMYPLIALESEVSNLERETGTKTRRIEKAGIDANGIVVYNTTDLICIKIEPASIIELLSVPNTNGSYYSFYSEEPYIGSITSQTENKRVVFSGYSTANISVPSNASWIAIKVNPGETAYITPSTFDVRENKKLATREKTVIIASSWTSGSFVRYTDGTIISSESYSISSDYIDCREIAEIYCNQPFGGNAGIAFFDKDGVYISGHSSDGLAGVYTYVSVPATAVIMLLSKRNDIDAYYYISKHRDESYKLGTEISFNLSETNKIVDVRNGEYLSNIAYNASDYVPCYMYKKIQVKQYYGGYAGLALYDKNYGFLKGVRHSDYSSSVTDPKKSSYAEINLPAGTAFFRVSSNTGFPYGETKVYGLDLSGDVLSELNENQQKHPVPLFGYSNKEINIVGDSITEGSGCTDDYNDSYAGILRHFFSLELGGNLNYGFCSMLPNLTQLKIAKCMMVTGGWSSGGWSRDDDNGDVYGNKSWTNIVEGATLWFSFRKAFNYMKIAHMVGASYGTYTVSVNNTVLATVSCSAVNDEAAYSALIDISDYPAGTTFTITATSGTICVSGASLIDNPDWWTFNNYGRAGMSGPLVSKALLLKELGSELAIYAHGTNGEPEYYISYFNNVKDDLKALGNKIIVLDTLWVPDNLDFPSTDARLQKRKIISGFATSIGATYIAVYPYIPKQSDGIHIVPGFLVDDSHPTNEGHRFVAETFAKGIGLCITSKGVAYESLHDEIIID